MRSSIRALSAAQPDDRSLVFLARFSLRSTLGALLVRAGQPPARMPLICAGKGDDRLANADTRAACAAGSLAADQEQAVAAARGRLVATGSPHRAVRANGPQPIRVSMRITKPTWFLPVIDVYSLTCSKGAPARPVTSATGAT